MRWDKINKALNIFLVVIIAAYAINYLYRLPRFDSGEKAPEFSAKLADSSEFSLNELKGKYILIDFWGSWCGPCRRENVSLVQLYQTTRNARYKDAGGFEIVSVALETNGESWKRAVEKDQLSWKYHVVELDRFSGPVATMYGVREIPTKYFIGPSGHILMVNPDFDEINQYLQERMQE
jgi:thiol-disulfide isomerase/thioredoxin